MSGTYMKQIVSRYVPSLDSLLREFCVEHYGSGYSAVLLYACSTREQNANVYPVYLIPEPLAILGAKAYTFFGVLPQVLALLYGTDVGQLPADILYPEDYYPETDIVGTGYVFHNYQGKLDYYFQFFNDFDTAKYVKFAIDAVEIEDWYVGPKVYVGEVTLDGWVRPYRPPTPVSYGRVEIPFMPGFWRRVELS